MGRRALVLLVALLLAGVAAFAVYTFVSGIEDEAIGERERVTVFRATQAVPEGQDGDLFLRGKRAPTRWPMSPPTSSLRKRNCGP